MGKWGVVGGEESVIITYCIRLWGPFCPCWVTLPRLGVWAMLGLIAPCYSCFFFFLYLWDTCLFLEEEEEEWIGGGNRGREEGTGRTEGKEKCK